MQARCHFQCCIVGASAQHPEGYALQSRVALDHERQCASYRHQFRRRTVRTNLRKTVFCLSWRREARHCQMCPTTHDAQHGWRMQWTISWCRHFLVVVAPAGLRTQMRLCPPDCLGRVSWFEVCFAPRSPYQGMPWRCGKRQLQTEFVVRCCACKSWQCCQ